MVWGGLVQGLALIGQVSLAERPRIRRHHVVKHHWGVHFKEPWRERMFLASGAFLTTFSIVRVVTHLIRNRVGPFKNVAIGGAHVHHLVWGIAILHLHGYVVLAGLEAFVHRRWAHRLAALGYGAGAAMTLDEFALWLRLEDVYWTREGRKSVDAVAIFGGLLAMGAWGGRFFHAVVRDLIWLRDFERRLLEARTHPEPPELAATDGDGAGTAAGRPPRLTISN